MTNKKENANDFKLPNLPINKWLLILLVFLSGLLCLLISRHIENYKIFSLILELLGAFLVIAIPLEILRELFFEEATRASFALQVSQLFDDKIDAELIQARKFGLDRIENSLPVKVLFDRLQQGDTLWWLDTYYPGHKIWIDNIRLAVQRGVSINMLILDPLSPFCAMRAKEIGYTNESFTAELRFFIADLEECRRNLNQKNGHITIFIYNNLLGVPCHVVTRDDIPIYAYSSMYLNKPTHVGDFPHFCWSQGPMCEILFNYVKEKSSGAVVMTL